MAGFIASFVGKKILSEHAQNHYGTEDPYFEQVPATRLNGRPSDKRKRIRKALPPGISNHDAQVLNKVKRRAYRLDLSLFNCCGVRFGWGALIGIIPFVGDAIDLLLARMVIRTAQQVDGGLPSHVVSKMYMNAFVDFVIGFVPFLGDVADAVYKCNTRNAVLLEKELRKRGQSKLKGQQTQILDPSLEEEFDREEEELRRREGRHTQRTEQASVDEPAQGPSKKSSGRGWLGGSRDRDAERAEVVQKPSLQQKQATQQKPHRAR